MSETQRYVDDLMQQFRELIVEIEEEQDELVRKLEELAVTAVPRRPLRRDNNNNNQRSRSLTNCVRDHRSNSGSSSLTTSTESSDRLSTALTATPTDEPSGAATISSGALSIGTATTSTKPPSYKTAIKPREPQPPPPPPPLPINHLGLYERVKRELNRRHIGQQQQRERVREREERDRVREERVLQHEEQLHHLHQQVPQRPPRSRRGRSSLPRDLNQHTFDTNLRYNTLLPGRSSLVTRTLDRTIMTSTSGMARGALIVFEGLDRVGKSTLAAKLVEHLERIKVPVSSYRFPDRTTPVGQLIDAFLKNNSRKVDDHTMHLLFSANRWELNKTIQQILTQGTTIVLDRYAYSGIAYSSAKTGLSINWCRETERGLPKPDLVIYLELPKEAQYRRPGFGDERFETEQLQEVIRGQYERVISMSQENWLRLDVENKSPDHLLGEIIVPVKRCVESSRNKEIGFLNFQ